MRAMSATGSHNDSVLLLDETLLEQQRRPDRPAAGR